MGDNQNEGTQAGLTKIQMTDTDLDTDECNGCTLNLIAELVLR
jgi:hypothetical protein